MKYITDFINKKNEYVLKVELLEKERWFTHDSETRETITDDINKLRCLINGLDDLITAMYNADCEELV